MDVYGTKKIRNVVLLGHGGAGKTTVAEALAYLTGVTKRMGKVADGNTISDYDKEEIKRQFSISTTLIPIEYEGAEGKVKINLLDTPGYFDFVGEVEEAVSVADAAIIVVNCKAGIEVGTEKAWELCEEYRLPRMIFVTNMDEFKSCRDVWTKDNDKAIFEASIDSDYLGKPSPYDFGYMAARQNGIQVRTCQFCKYHKNGYEVGFGLLPIFCCLYKKYGTPENPEPQYAGECEYYMEDRNVIDEISSQMPAIVIAKSNNDKSGE